MQERNVHKMNLVEGEGNAFVDGKPLEDDEFNKVHVLVSQLPSLLHRVRLQWGADIREDSMCIA